ncbi:MAG: hypothetical protein BJ554DRAFT_3675, partial [Olpidium bornovanus]
MRSCRPSRNDQNQPASKERAKRPDPDAATDTDTGRHATKRSSTTGASPAKRSASQPFFPRRQADDDAPVGQAEAMSQSETLAAATNKNNRRTGNTIRQIFKATYSNVPVFEYVCRGVGVMRRRSDAYVNATHILKVANFSKPQRTKILESEIHTGHHEKVQGGYGKYQDWLFSEFAAGPFAKPEKAGRSLLSHNIPCVSSGTWVPLPRAIEIASQFGVEEDIRPLFDYVVGDQSPPQAPKHITAASVRPKKSRKGSPAPARSAPAEAAGPPLSEPAAGAAAAGVTSASEEDHEHAAHGPWLSDALHAAAAGSSAVGVVAPEGAAAGPAAAPLGKRAAAVEAKNNLRSSLRPKRSPPNSVPSAAKAPAVPDAAAAAKRTSPKKPSAAPRGPVQKSSKKGKSAGPVPGGKPKAVTIQAGPPHYGAALRRHLEPSSAVEDDDGTILDETSSDSETVSDRAGAVLLRYFASTDGQVPQILITPPASLDINMSIDRDGNSSLHWAAMTARIIVVQYMMSHFAVDVNRVNSFGQTALAKAVQYPHNRSFNTFPVLLDYLQPSLQCTDRNGRSLLHHIIIAEFNDAEEAHAVYYLHHTLARIQANPQQYAWFLDAPDRRGDTPLAAARRLGRRHLPRMLLNAGARDVFPELSDDSDGDPETLDADVEGLALPGPGEFPSSPDDDPKERASAAFGKWAAETAEDYRRRREAIEEIEAEARRQLRSTLNEVEDLKAAVGRMRAEAESAREEEGR